MLTITCASTVGGDKVDIEILNDEELWFTAYNSSNDSLVEVLISKQDIVRLSEYLLKHWDEVL